MNSMEELWMVYDFPHSNFKRWIMKLRVLDLRVRSVFVHMKKHINLKAVETDSRILHFIKYV